jgi:hypothetical protein
MSFPTPSGDGVPGSLLREPQVCLGPTFANGTYQFFVSGSAFATPANVYQDAGLTTPFPNTGVVNADMYGRFPPIYLDGSIIYGVILTNAVGAQTYAIDPYVTPLSVRGLSTNVTYGPQIAATGEVVLLAPAAGGSQITMSLSASVAGQSALQLTGSLAGSPALIVNNSATTGAQTATFTATNKPGTATSTPAGWLPIQVDGVIMYTPVWHGNNFTPYVANPAAVGETINGLYVNFAGNGITTVTSGTAVPGNWFSPSTNNIGASYWINITKTVGNSGTSFSAAQGSWVNITNGGLTIGTVGSVNTVLTGTYQLSTSAGGTPVVASGTIQLSGNNTGASPGTGANDKVSISGAAPFILAGNGTTTYNGVAGSNWFLPTTVNEGSLYWINITRTGGTSGVNFSAAQGAWTNITNGGLTLNLTGTGARTASGTYQISSNAGGTLIVASGSITLNSTGVLNTNWNGTTPLVLSGNGTATLNGVATTSWYSPTTANVGSGFWINISRTSGTTGVNFSAAQGSWTNITNSSLSIGLSGTSGLVGTATATGSYSISSSATGTPVVGSGTITLTLTGLTVIHVYTTVVSNSTETILTGTTNVAMECWAGGGGGGNGTAGCSGQDGVVGGSGSYGYRQYTAAALGGVGKTFKYTIGAGGSGDSVNGSASQIIAGTVTGFTSILTNGGHAGVNHAQGTGGAAGTGGSTNTAGLNNSQTGVVGIISGDGSQHGGGGSAGHLGGGSGGAGAAGACVFYYT